ncbi:MAG: hypothetical protein QOD76_1611 [Solirubrobacteraceae bacterium]|nr:hypothetical protein [Solirubrobacteraceae bacterium]MDX6668260.1 hypothetical protein [Solirubrobacteraceae bacterium]
MTTARDQRDASRSRANILDAAERLFVARGFESTSLAEIAADAGLSRATPSYFFGNKEQLYIAVLERVFAEREEATREAFEPLVAWAAGDGSGSLEAALTAAVEGYFSFLQERPAFVRLLQTEELRGGRQLRAVHRDSAAMSDAFAAVRRVAGRRGLRSFRVADAVLVLVSLTFSPLTQGSTFMLALRRDLDDARTRRAHIRLVVDQVMSAISGGSSSPRR